MRVEGVNKRNRNVVKIRPNKELPMKAHLNYQFDRFNQCYQKSRLDFYNNKILANSIANLSQ